MSDCKCKYCDGTKVIRFELPSYSDFGNMHDTCPCVEIDRQKHKAELYKQLAETMTETIVKSLETVSRLMPNAKNISDNACDFSKRQIKGIESI